MTTTPTASDAAAHDAVVYATEAVDAAWAEHDAIREPMRADGRTIIDKLSGATGLQLNPGAERLIDEFLDYAEMKGEELVKAAQARAKALVAEADRADKLAAIAPAEPDAAPPTLVKNDPIDTRHWLLSANDNDVRDALNEILDRDTQVEWATRLMTWARADGTTAQVLAAINSVLIPKDTVPKPNPNEQIPETASAEDIPTKPAGPPPTDPTELVAWIGNDAARAHLAFDTEMGSPTPRPEVLATLTDIIDASTPGPVPADGPTPPPATEPIEAPKS